MYDYTGTRRAQWRRHVDNLKVCVSLYVLQICWALLEAAHPVCRMLQLQKVLCCLDHGFGMTPQTQMECFNARASSRGLSAVTGDTLFSVHGTGAIDGAKALSRAPIQITRPFCDSGVDQGYCTALLYMHQNPQCEFEARVQASVATVAAL